MGARRTHLLAGLSLAAALAGGLCLPGVALAVTGTGPSVQASFSPGAIVVGGTTTLTVTLADGNIAADGSMWAHVEFDPARHLPGMPSGTCYVGTLMPFLYQILLISPKTSCTATFPVTGATIGSEADVVSAAVAGWSGSTFANLDVYAPPTLSASFASSSVVTGRSDTLTYTLTSPSGNPSSLDLFPFTTTLPIGLSVASGTSSVCNGGILTTVAPSTIGLQHVQLWPGEPCQVTIAVTGVTPGNYTVTSGTVSSLEGGRGNAASANVSVVGISPPTISAAFGTSTLTIGGTTTLGFTIANPNGVTPMAVVPAGVWTDPNTLSGIGFVDTLPSGLAIATPNGLTGSCGGGSVTATAGSGSVSLSGATLAPQASCAFSVQVVALAAGSQQDSTGPVGSTEGGNGSAGGASLTVQGAAVTPAPSVAATPPPTSTSAPSSSGDGSGLPLVAFWATFLAGACVVWRGRHGLRENR